MADIFVQRGVTTVNADGQTASIGSAVSSLDNAFVIITGNRHVGSGASTGNMEGDDLAVQARLTGTNTITFDRPSPTPGINTIVRWEVWEYTGSPGGANEFIVRSRDELTETSGSDTATLTNTPTNIDDCIPFINGAMTSDTANGANGMAVRAWLSSTATLNGSWGETDTTTKTMHVTTVEFTGSNWSVGHGTVTGQTADSGTINLVTGADGISGSTFDVGDWTTAIIASWGHAGDGTNEAIADNWPTLIPGANTTSVTYTFNSQHDGTDDDITVHILQHDDVVVTRFTNTSNTAGITNVDVTSAGLTDLTESSVLGTTTSSGGGTAYARGWRTYRLTSLTNVEHHCGRSGNTMDHRLQVIDWSGVVTVGGTPGSATPGVITASVAAPAVSVEGGAVTQPATVAASTTLPQATVSVPSGVAFQYPGDLASGDVWWAIDAAQITGHSDGAKTVEAVADQTGNEPDSTADTGEEAVYRSSTHFRRATIEGDGSTHLDFDWDSSHSPPGFTITAHKWLTGTGIRNVLHSAKKGEGPPNKHVQGTQSGLSNEGGEFHVLMSGDGSGPAHLDPSTAPGADGGDIDTVFVDEECVTIYTCAANGDVELWKYTAANGWEQLIDGNSGDNAFNGFSVFSREDGNTQTMANLAISYMLAGDMTNYDLDDLKLAAEDIAEWCHIKPVVQRFQLNGVTAELAIDYTDTNPYNLDRNGPLETDVVLTVTGGTIHLEIDNALGLSWIDSNYAAGQHTLTLPIINLDMWKDMTEIRMSVV